MRNRSDMRNQEKSKFYQQELKELKEQQVKINSELEQYMK
jgi:hypothetical protein